MRPAVFLDRDGVLNESVVKDGKPYPPADLSQLALVPGAAEACAALKGAGFVLVCVTNQPDVARGAASPQSVREINDAIARAMALDDLRVCPHDDADGCDCRKPKPGLLLRAAADHGLDLARSVMVGDRWRDVEAGQAAGVATVFIDRGYDERRPETYDHTGASLAEVAPWIIRRFGAPALERTGND